MQRGEEGLSFELVRGLAFSFELNGIRFAGNSTHLFIAKHTGAEARIMLFINKPGGSSGYYNTYALIYNNIAN